MPEEEIKVNGFILSFARFKGGLHLGNKQSDISLAGSSCLLQTITKTISNYMMNFHALPKQILRKINTDLNL